MAIADSLFGSYTNRNKKRISNLLDRVNSFALDCSKITTSKETSSIIENGRARRCTVEEKAFYDKTREFRDRLRDGESIQSIMPEALAVCREAIKRRLNMFPYDTQIEASIAMLGNVIGTNNDNEEVRERIIAEMKTGEGKTLVQILVAYLNALEATKDIDPRNWKSVHVMTSNDALAKRDCTDNGKVFNLLGLTCGFVPSNRSMKATTLAEQAINRRKKQTAYNSDVVYATTSTIAFDYLSDNRITDPKNRRINKEFGYAIIDEADDLLLDQAINPLILSGKQIGEEISEDTLDIKDYYKWATEFLYGKTRGKELTCVVCEKFERSKYKTFTEEHVEKLGVDYVIFLDSSEVVINPKIAEELSTSKSEDVNNMKYIALMDAIKAKHLFLKNVQYEVKVNGEEGTVILLDQNTGRRKYTSKYTEGMQEAVEAKEDFLENESKLAKKRYRIKFSKNIATKAMCTYPDFLSLYKGRVCGMTGTSDIDEMREIYGFETYEVPYRLENIRKDESDLIYATISQKNKAIIEEVLKCQKIGRPVLIGTTSIEESKIISNMLNQNGVKHQLLNATNEEEENKIIENAGLLGMVTVSTNMAGRGTDIKLGPGVKEVGGLYVIGTSKNKSKRIDRQLIGRAARQGDPGGSRYFASLEDELVKLNYPNDTLKGLISLYKKTDEPINNSTVKKIIDKSQERKESFDKESRIISEKFNKTFTEHKQVIYELRNEILNASPVDFITYIRKIMVKYVDYSTNMYGFEDMKAQLKSICNIDGLNSSNPKQYKQNIIDAIFDKFRSNFSSNVTTEEVLPYYRRMRLVFLNIIDEYWIGHMETLSDLRNKYTYGRQYNDPFEEYAKEANIIFSKSVMTGILNEILTYATNPDLRFGEYDIELYSNDLEKKKIIV